MRLYVHQEGSLRANRAAKKNLLMHETIQREHKWALDFNVAIGVYFIQLR